MYYILSYPPYSAKAGAYRPPHARGTPGAPPPTQRPLQEYEPPSNAKDGDKAPSKNKKKRDARKAKAAASQEVGDFKYLFVNIFIYLIPIFKSKEMVSLEEDTKWSLIGRIRKQQTTFFRLAVRREKLEHVVTTGVVEKKTQPGKTARKDVGWNSKLIKVLGLGGMTDALKVRRHQEMRKVMIAMAVAHDRLNPYITGSLCIILSSCDTLGK